MIWSAPCYGNSTPTVLPAPNPASREHRAPVTGTQTWLWRLSSGGTTPFSCLTGLTNAIVVSHWKSTVKIFRTAVAKSRNFLLAPRMPLTRNVRGSRKRIPGCDPKDLDPGSVRIIDPTLTVCRRIHWDHRPAFAIRQEIHSDPRSKTPYCVGIHRDPISGKRKSRILYVFFFLKR